MRASILNRMVGYALAILGVAATTDICVALREQVNPTTAALALLLVVLLTGMTLGSRPGILATLAAMLCFNFFFLPPVGRLTVADPRDWIALIAFLAAAGATGHLAVRSRRRAAEAAEAARLQAALADLEARVLRGERCRDVMDQALGLVAWNIDVEYCEILEELSDEKDLLLRAGVGWERELIGRTKIVRGAESQAGYTLLSGAPVVVGDLRREERFRPSPLLLEHRIVSGASVVIATGEGPWGVLAAHTTRPRRFGPTEVGFLRSVANILGMTIERERDQDALRESERNLNRAQELAQVGSWHLDILRDRLNWSDEVFRIFGVTPGTPLTYEAFLAFVHPEDRSRVSAAWSAAMRGAPYDVEHRVVVEGRIKWVRERASVTFDEARAPIEGIGTVQDITGDKATEEHIRALNADLERRVAARTAELEAAQGREVAIGFRIQQTLLLDRPPQGIPWLRVAALTVPSQRIDGDFYSFYQHDDGSLDLVVADVMGKGLRAALLGAAVKSYFMDALSLLLGAPRGGLPQPAEIVTQTHAEIVQRLIELESFVTLCYVRLDPREKTLTFVDCGHTGIIQWHAATRTCDVLHGDNLPLGIREGELYDQAAASFEPGDALLLFSDGVTEARNREGELFGDDRLTECVLANSGREPAELVEAVRKAAVEFAGAEGLDDDLTCVAVRIVESELPVARSVIELRSRLQECARARRFVRDLCAGLPQSPLDEEGVCQLQLAVTEACSNVIKYAYRGRDDQWIHLEAEAYRDAVLLRLRYLGAAFDASQVPPPALNGSREDGFGLYLIDRSVDEARYFRDERGRNCIVLVKRRAAAGAERSGSWIS